MTRSQPRDGLEQLREARPAAAEGKRLGARAVFLEALRRNPHPMHSTVDQSLKTVELLRPRRAFFTHISHDLEHDATNATLPGNIRLAHDGLQLTFDIAPNS